MAAYMSSTAFVCRALLAIPRKSVLALEFHVKLDKFALVWVLVACE
jgi:hypothetical protein